ncbi:hypothetical protein CK203_015022 [Vitis vinifera]|uniref:Uncharacterized protein n=1 Tax=Vitis vinifera TaxID=29760 RepID=A0A438JD63_VITVI|nr:hypothetical protein CK203_015022 [Vitis vinifera]
MMETNAILYPEKRFGPIPEEFKTDIRGQPSKLSYASSPQKNRANLEGSL